MTYKLFVAAALSLGLGTAVAMAQTDTVQPEPGAASDSAVSTQLPAGWDGAIGDAFFSNPEHSTLRSKTEASANWETLTDEQRAQVRAYCDTIDTAAAGATDAPSGDAAAGADAMDDQVTTGSTAADNATNVAAIEQVCDMVATM